MIGSLPSSDERTFVPLVDHALTAGRDCLLVQFHDFHVWDARALWDDIQFDPSFLAPSSYPSTGNILTRISLTFFAFTGFGVISNTAGDMPNPSRTLPRAIYLSIGLVSILYLGLCFAGLWAARLSAQPPGNRNEHGKKLA